jgi:hypothetical protein
VVQEKDSTVKWGIMYFLEGAKLQELHGAPTVQEINTFKIRVQIPHRVLPQKPW